MFGHQDEPQKPFTTSFDAPSADPAADSSLDAVIASAPVSTVGPTMALLEPQAPDGITPTAPTVSAPPVDTPAQPAIDTNTLLDIKQQALQQLSPLVGHLDQSPEEKFRTTMMMIQATDNQDLVGGAYAAAQAITDEKARAQALLDIVNEINYFTQRQGQ
jgi:hypothetical protein